MHEEHGAHEMKPRGRHEYHAGMIADFRRRFFISLALTVPVLLLSPVVRELLRLQDVLTFPGDIYVLWALSSVVYFYGGFPFLRGIIREIKAKRPAMMTLIALAITVAYVYSSAVVFGLSGTVFFWELATLIDVMLLGHWLEMRATTAATSALEELARLMPSVAHRLHNSHVQDVSLDELVAGDRVLVKPGEKVPADSRVIEGESSVNEALLTGESKPVSKQPGANLIGGSVNGEGSLVAEVTRTGKDSYLAQITELVRSAQESRSRSQDIADRAALALTIVALAGGAITIILWLTVLSQTFEFALERMVTVMVIACPHALGLAIPLVVAVSTSLSARRGLLIKNREAFERARHISAVLFDKTGTLTEGRFGVTDIISLDGMAEDQVLKYAASVETRSEHSIAKGLVASAGETLPAEEVTALPGRGLEGG